MYDEVIVSVIIPTYNRAKTITASVKSVLDQTFDRLEVIVVDDGSTDNTEEVLKEISDSRLHYYKTVNAGACHARNYGIDHSTGRYIAFHDSDDIWLKEKLEKQIKVLEERKADMVICSLFVNAAKKTTIYPHNISDGKVTLERALYGGVGSTQVFLGKREVFEELRFDERMPRSQDTELLIRIVREYHVEFMKEPLCNKYDQDDSLTRNVGKMIYAQKRILKKFEKEFNQYPKAKAMHYNVIANAKALLGKHNLKERKLALVNHFCLNYLVKYILSVFRLDRYLVKL